MATFVATEAAGTLDSVLQLHGANIATLLATVKAFKGPGFDTSAAGSPAEAAQWLDEMQNIGNGKPGKVTDALPELMLRKRNKRKKDEVSPSTRYTAETSTRTLVRILLDLLYLQSNMLYPAVKPRQHILLSTPTTCEN